MQSKIDEFTLSLKNELNVIENELSDYIDIAEHSIDCIIHCLKQLKDYIYSNPFMSKEDEIYFFKVTKPSIYSDLIFYIEIFKLESKCLIVDKTNRKKYLLKNLKKYNTYFTENYDFFTYYRSKSTYLDDKYFLRSNFDFRLNIDDFVYDSDPNFTTGYDYKVAKILANERLIKYVNNEIIEIDNPGEIVNTKKFEWTETKAALVELIYALHSNGCINNGNEDIKDIASLFESIFNIDLGDIYRSFLEIKIRQNPTKFIDTLKISLEKRIDENL